MLLSRRGSQETETEVPDVAMVKRQIFRERAIQSYRQGREKDILPRFVSPPVFLFLWIILGLCLVAGWVAWSIRVPIYVDGTGVMAASEARVVVFVSAVHQQRLHAGEPVQMQLGTTGPRLRRTVTTVVPTLLSPEEARQDYHLDGTLALLVTEPSVVLVIALDASSALSAYAGSIVSAHVQVGDVRLLSFLPLVGQWIGA